MVNKINKKQKSEDVKSSKPKAQSKTKQRGWLFYLLIFILLIIFVWSILGALNLLPIKNNENDEHNQHRLDYYTTGPEPILPTKEKSDDTHHDDNSKDAVNISHSEGEINLSVNDNLKQNKSDLMNNPELKRLVDRYNEFLKDKSNDYSYIKIFNSDFLSSIIRIRKKSANLKERINIQKQILSIIAK